MYIVAEYTWDKCKEKADCIVENLIEEGYSGQDIMFISTQLLQAGIYVIMREAIECEGEE